MSLQAISFDDIILDMGRNRKKRHAASEAVIALREALGHQTQQSFAHKMKTAIVTIARWETSQPPHGTALLRLAGVAKQAWLKDKAGPDVESPFEDLQFKFFDLYMREVMADVSGLFTPGEQPDQLLITNPKTGTGWLLANPQESAQIHVAGKFVLDFKDAKTKC